MDNTRDPHTAGTPQPDSHRRAVANHVTMRLAGRVESGDAGKAASMEL